jgi:hypothetical protein
MKRRAGKKNAGNGSVRVRGMAEVWAWLLSVVQHSLSCWAVVFGPDQLSFLEMIN